MILITEIGLRSTVNQRLKRSIFFLQKCHIHVLLFLKNLKKLSFEFECFLLLLSSKLTEKC